MTVVDTRANVPAVVMLTGPTCVGKRTLAALLPADRVQILDLQVFARGRAAAGLAAGRAIAGLPSPRVYPAAAVDELLRDALVQAMVPALGHTVVVPGLPATVEQVDLLATLTRSLGVPGAAVELEAFSVSLLVRRERRRICLACCPDPGGEPHIVAPPGDERYIVDVSDDRLRDTCAGCRARLFVRARDGLPSFRRRVQAYRAVAPALRRAARAAGLGWFGINTSDKQAQELSRDPEYDGAADTRTTVARDVETALTRAGLLPIPARLAAAAESL